jgi:hypothetical protein
MTEPVLVIHGINNPDKTAFLATVQALEEQFFAFSGSSRANFTFVPVYWGDLGGKTTLLERSFPPRDQRALTSDPTDIMNQTRGISPTLERTPAELETQITHILEGTRGGTASDTLEPMLREKLPQTEYLSQLEDVEALHQIGHLLEQQLNTLSGTNTQSFDDIMNAPRGVLDDTRGWNPVQALDKLAGAITRDQVAKLYNAGLMSARATLAHTIGDLIAYQRNQDAIQQRLWDALTGEFAEYGRTAQKPVHAVAHSQGGIITFDAALSTTRPLHLKSLTTFGSQSALIHLVDPRQSLGAFQGLPLTLPATFGRWINLWEPLDPLAFVIKPVFKLANGTLEDRRIDVPNTFSDIVARGGWFTHSSYWTSQELLKAIRDNVI